MATTRGEVRGKGHFGHPTLGAILKEFHQRASGFELALVIDDGVVHKLRGNIAGESVVDRP